MIQILFRELFKLFIQLWKKFYPIFSWSGKKFNRFFSWFQILFRELFLEKILNYLFNFYFSNFHSIYYVIELNRHKTSQILKFYAIGFKYFTNHSWKKFYPIFFVILNFISRILLGKILNYLFNFYFARK